jgi:hypothetical protein
MNYLKMFKDVGIIDNDPNFFTRFPFDIENNCRKSNEALSGVIYAVYNNSDFYTDLSGFIMELKNLYKEVGFNLGCLFIERYFNEEIHLNFCGSNKTDMNMILSVNVYIDMIFNRNVDKMIKTDIENIFSGMQDKISLLKHDFNVESGVPETAINFVLNSAELKMLSYFLIKTGFKFGFFLHHALISYTNSQMK